MPRPLDRVREALRARHYSIRAEEAYVRRVRQYILFFDRRHPSERGAKVVSAFVSHPASERQVSAATQSLTLSALLFLYQEVLDMQVEWVDDVERAGEPQNLPVVFTREAVGVMPGRPRGREWLTASLLYGSGLRLMECVRLKAVKGAVRAARINKPGRRHTLGAYAWLLLRPR